MPTKTDKHTYEKVDEKKDAKLKAASAEQEQKRKAAAQAALRGVRIYFISATLILEAIESLKKLGLYKQRIKQMTTNLENELMRECMQLSATWKGKVGTELLFSGQVAAMREVTKNIDNCESEDEFSTLISYVRNWALVKDALMERIKKKAIELEKEKKKVDRLIKKG